MKPLVSLQLDEQEALWNAAVKRLEKEGTRLKSPEELQQVRTLTWLPFPEPEPV